MVVPAGLATMSLSAPGCKPGPDWVVLHPLFYADSNRLGHPSLLLFQVNALVFVASNGRSDLFRSLAQLGLLVGIKAFLGAG